MVANFKPNHPLAINFLILFRVGVFFLKRNCKAVLAMTCAYCQSPLLGLHACYIRYPLSYLPLFG